MTDEDRVRIARAIILLQDEPATTGVMHALALLDAALPRSGTPARRAAFAAAHELAQARARLAATGRLEYLRTQLRAECISYGELHELQGLAEHIAPGDVELLEAAGVPEHDDE